MPPKKIMKKVLKSKSVESYIASAPKEVQGKLKELRAIIKKAAPDAEERISYGMPFYEYEGTGFKGRLVYFSAFKNILPYIFLPRVLEAYRTSLRSIKLQNPLFIFL